MGIVIRTPEDDRWCNVCDVKDGTVKELVFESSQCGIVVAVCEKCRKELFDKLKALPKKKVPTPPGFKNIRAKFIGRDGSCGFNNNMIYELWMVRADGKIYISRRNLSCTAIPYDTMEAFSKNWIITEEGV